MTALLGAFLHDNLRYLMKSETALKIVDAHGAAFIKNDVKFKANP